MEIPPPRLAQMFLCSVSLAIAAATGCQRSTPRPQPASLEPSPVKNPAEQPSALTAFEHVVDHKHPHGVLIKRYRGTEASVAIPDAVDGKPVVRIESDAFHDNSTLRSVHLPDSLVEIGNMSFKSCTGLRSVRLPDTLHSLGWNAFENCGLERVTIPRSVTHIGDVCFFGCQNLSTIEVDDANSAYASVDGVLYDKDVKTLLCCPPAKEGVLRIPASVTTIKEWALANCRKLTQVFIPSATTTIGENAFNSCRALRDTERRNRWVAVVQGDRHVFQRSSDGTWKESSEAGKDQFTFREVKATPEYVLLKDDSRNMELRLGERAGEWRLTTEEEKWMPLREGGWEEKPSDTKTEKQPDPTAAEKQASPEASSDKQALDPATVERVTAEEARQLTASAGAELSLPRLRDLSVEAARDLATSREQSKTVKYTVMVPYAEEREVTYTVMVPYTEEVTQKDGAKQKVEKCREEVRTRTFTVTKCRPEERTRRSPVVLALAGLESPGPEVLAELAKHDGQLRLNGLKALTRQEAESLTRHNGGTLVLDGLVSLDSVVAEQLANFQGDLSLNGIHRLPIDIAKPLAGHRGGLSLNGVTELTDQAAVALAAHEGSVSLMGLRDASMEVLQLLEGKPVALPPELAFQSPKSSD